MGAGHATVPAVNGASIDRIAAQTRHRGLGTCCPHPSRRSACGPPPAVAL